MIPLPDFDWGITQGDTEAESVAMAADALLTMIQDHIRRGEPLPRPTRPRGWKYRTIGLSALQSAKAELHMAFLASGIRNAEPARRTGIPNTTVDRLFDMKHQLTWASLRRQPSPLSASP